jgi:hypothetical protein
LFALCWLQIVVHTNAFHRSLESGDICAVVFCRPELLHKRLLAVLITVASVVSRQTRRGASRALHPVPLPIGFNAESSLIGHPRPVPSSYSAHVPQSAPQFIAVALTRPLVEAPDRIPRLIWQFVFFGITTVAPHSNQSTSSWK